LVVQDTEVVPDKKPHVKKANGIPLVVVLVLLATPLIVSASIDSDEGETQVASLHLSELHTRTSRHPIRRRSAAVPCSRSICVSRKTTKLNGSGAASFLRTSSEGTMYALTMGDMRASLSTGKPAYFATHVRALDWAVATPSALFFEETWRKSATARTVGLKGQHPEHAQKSDQ
jgi:hypothetical protein